MSSAAQAVRKVTDPASREDAVAEAARLLNEGRLVVIPTETVYGVAVDARFREGVGRLRGLRESEDTDLPLAWHAADAATAADVIGLEHPVHRRLFARLTPGPVTFVVELGEDRLAQVRHRLGVGAGVIDDGRLVAVRVPADPVACAILSRAGGTVVAEGVSRVGMGPGREAPGRVHDEVSLVVDAGPTLVGRASSIVRLTARGGWSLASAGAIDERYIEKQLHKLVLFVCTGNTCRSPMAMALARALAGESDSGVRTEFASAGVAAGPGMEATPEAVAAVGRLGGDLSGHRSRQLTREMLAEAEVVFVMSPSHAEGIRSLSPSASGRVETLDPSGASIEDPIGADQGVYDRTAQRIMELVRKRLEEMRA